ncbi:MAG: hypothetical protein IT534_09235 [Bauldia sp.]|nr:hypothetical protein [Bauldia sp.]
MKAGGRADAAIVNMLWIEGALPWYARLSIATFLAQGHRVHLHSYGEAAGVPAGCVVRDASEVLSRDTVFAYRNGPFAGYFSGFANWFRCEVLLRDGGWWADTDVLCRRPFRADGDYLIASQWREGGREINNNVLFVRDSGSDLMRRAVAFCRERGGDVAHTENGPLLMASLVDELRLRDRVAPPARFNPIHYSDISLLLERPARVRLVALTRPLRRLRPVHLARAFGLHLYAAWSMRNERLRDPATIPNDSYLARFVERCGVAWPGGRGAEVLADTRTS